jgi:hypothetical protein
MVGAGGVVAAGALVAPVLAVVGAAAGAVMASALAVVGAAAAVAGGFAAVGAVEVVAGLPPHAANKTVTRLISRNMLIFLNLSVWFKADSPLVNKESDTGSDAAS